MSEQIQQTIRALRNPAHAEVLRRFFKTGPGQYSEGDEFLGIKVPVLRQIAREYQDLSVQAAENLLRSSYHEERLTALFILIRQYQKGVALARDEIYQIYTDNLHAINNWDLVDSSAPYIPGPHLYNKDRKILQRWARSQHLWTRRIAMLTCFYFIKQQDFTDTLIIAEALLQDPHDLIHKAVGWMLREVGKRNLAVEEAFLSNHYKNMPRTMLRYAIEKFPETRRKAYLAGVI